MSEETTVDLGATIYDMLGLDPGMLGVMSPADDGGNGRALLGLGKIVRRSIELGLQMRDRRSLTLRLKTSDEQARAWGYGDVASANLGMLLLWSTVRGPRLVGGLRYAPLMAADEKIVDLAPQVDTSIRAMSNQVLVEKAIFTPVRPGRELDETTPDDVPGASLYDLTKSLLRLHTTDIATVLYDTVNEMVPDLANKPENLAGHRLVHFLTGVGSQFRIMLERDVRKIQLRTDADAAEAEFPGGAAAANLTTIIAASLFADEKHKLTFLAAKERSAEEREMLRDMARWVYVNYNNQLHDGLTLFCESNRHFGTQGRFGIADRLLHDVRLEVDPKLEKMPVFVQAIEAGLGLPSRDHLWWQEAS